MTHSTPRLSIRLVKQTLAALSMALVFATSSNAFEVGELTLLSQLGDPLLAQVTFKHQPRLNKDELIVEQAPLAIYQQMNVDSSALNIDLTFKIDPSGIISIRTLDPVKEPFVSFIMKFQWPEGELYKEYNLLIDP